ncbi:MAG TPA: hypothetical protein P5567_02320 [Kiritimatiellia bacterium]|nr:hypothetical protein [Kiritimatiellia bacterium]HRZ11268.1 hypothetical protein [Kiritimatiellia bacterium]HSA19119.1 hypothetical protein [Kiritimatiellia bacterium]
MERGAKALSIMLLLALALGAVIIAVNPMYRQAAIAMWKGEPEKSPIWISNSEYYPDVALEGRPASPSPEEDQEAEVLP